MNLLLFLAYQVVVAAWLLPRRSLTSLDAVLVVSWLAPTAFSLVGVISYDDDIDTKTLAILIGYHAAVLIGINTAGGADLAQSKPGLPVAALAVIVFVATIVLSIKEAQSVGITDLAIVRAEHWEEPGEATLSRRILGWLAVLTFALANPKVWGRTMSVLGIAALAAFGVQSLLTTGGRLNASIAVLMIAYCAAPKTTWTKLLKPRLVLAAIGLAVFFWVAGVTIMQQRSRSLLEKDIDEMLAESGAGQVSASGQWMVDWLGLDGAYAVAATGYFTRPMFSLSFFTEHTDLHRLGLLGRYNLRPIAARIGQGQAFNDAREYIAGLRGSVGLSINPWATAWRDYSIDFGLIGGGLFAFLVGYGLQKSLSVWTAPIAAAILAFTPYLSLLFLGPVLFGLLAALAISKCTIYVPFQNRTVQQQKPAYARGRTWHPRVWGINSPEQNIAEMPKLTLNQEVAGSSPARGTSGSSTSEDSTSAPRGPIVQ